MKKLLLLSMFISPTIFANDPYCKLGTEQWVEGCSTSCTAGWEGNTCPKSCTATAPVGYVIKNFKHTELSENNGDHSIEKISANQNFNYSNKISKAYSDVLDAAIKANDKDGEIKIRNDMDSKLSEFLHFNSSHNLIKLNVNASKHGSWFDRKRGWSNHKVELLIQCVVPSNLEQQLYEKYGLL